MDDTNEIIFANDSCYGPLKPLNLFINKWEKENKPDFYGITINNFGLKYSSVPIVNCKFPHIQSYFFLITKNIFEKEFFQNFLGDVHHFDTMLGVVKTYEMGLSDLIVKNGFKLKAYFDFKDYKKDPTRDGTKMLATIKNGFFIKKKNDLVKSQDKNFVNYYLQRSNFPYILNINFKLKRYNYKISNKCVNSIKIIDNNSKSTLKEKKLEGLEIVINGKRNSILIDKNAKFKNSKIEL